uniref:LisH domain-containing protein n=2 Tax=Macrostomum lignano TaxID=282301 RepID=A0A1I8IHS5_9PLAT
MSFSNIMENILPAMVFSASAFRSGAVGVVSSGASAATSGRSYDRRHPGSAGTTRASAPEEDSKLWSESVATAQLLPTQDLNRLVLEYLVHEGHLEAAETFCREAGLEPNILQESESGEDSQRRVAIRSAVQDGRIDEAIELINEANPELLDLNQELHFHLRRQQLVELVREGRLCQALQFAQSSLASLAEAQPDSCLSDLEECMALLAFERPAESASFGRWLSLSHRAKLASEVNAALLEATADDEGGESSTGDRDSCGDGLDYQLRLLLWSQDRLTAAGVSYPRIVDVETARYSEQPQQRDSAT